MARISSEENDTGYLLHQYHLGVGNQIAVFLNGKEVNWAITADEDEGFVICAELDIYGYPKADWDKGDFVYERKEGDVRIEVSPKDD